MTNQIKILIVINFLILALSLNAQALFEVKDASDNSVFEITNDGIRIFNYPDTLMIISSAEIRANLDNSKGLSRSFSVSTNATGKGGGDVVNIDADGLRVYNGEDKLMDITGTNITAYIDSNSTKGLSRSFSVSTNATGKAEIDILNVTTETTKMREGTLGRGYTDFSEDNIFLGLNAGAAINDGLYNVFIGNNSGLTTTCDGDPIALQWGAYNTFIGFGAGENATYGFNSTYIGTNSGSHNIHGQDNAFLGKETGWGNTGSQNTFIGSKTCGGGSDANGSYNTFLGYEAGFENTFGSYNTYVGRLAGGINESGWMNVFLGNEAGCNNIDGSGNVFLGSFAGYFELGSNKLYIDNGSTTTPLIYGDFSTNDLSFNGETRIMNSANATDQKGLVIDTDGEYTDIPLRIRTNGSASGWTDADTKFVVWGDGSVDIPSLYTTTSANSKKSLYVDTNGKLCVTSKGDGASNEEVIELLKKENEKLKIENDEINNRLNEIEKLLKNIE